MNPKSTNNMWKALFITLIIALAEIVGGILSNSLALISDAWHMITDITSLVISLWAFQIAKRELTLKKTFGYHRTEIIAALFNGIFLVFLVFYILHQSYLRFISPQQINTKIMFLVAVIGLIANIISISFLHKDSKENLNSKGAFLHILGDAVSSVGVIIGSVIIYWTKLFIIDAFISLIIGMLILYSAINLIAEAIHILLEGVPKHLSIDEITEEVKIIEGVEEIHDVHIWTITSGIYALSGHLLVEEQPLSKSNEILNEVTELLKKDFNICHTTLQLESTLNNGKCYCEFKRI